MKKHPNAIAALLLLALTALTPALSLAANKTEKVWPDRLRGFTVGIPMAHLETAEPYKRMRAWHANVMTINLTYDANAKITKEAAVLCPPVPDHLQPYRGMLHRVDKIVTLAKEHGIYLVFGVDHALGNDAINVANDLPPEENLIQEQAYIRNAISLNVYLAERYKDEIIVLAYNFITEPHTRWIAEHWETKVIPDFVKAIREVDNNTYLIFSGGLWGDPSFASKRKTGSVTTPVTDPANKTIYGWHDYAPHNYTHQGLGKRPSGLVYPGKLKMFNSSKSKDWGRAEFINYMQPALDFMKKYDVKMFVGEFGVVRWAEGADQWFDDKISVFEEYGISWSCHNYAGSWDGWNVTIASDDPRRAVADGHVDTPQLKVITKYMKRNVIKPNADKNKAENINKVATTPGLVAFWDFSHEEGESWGSYFDPKVVERSFPVKLKRIGDPKSYTAESWAYQDEKSKLMTDQSGPFGKGVRFNKGYIYAGVDRKEFDGTPLNMHGKTPFTMIAWCKYIPGAKRHMVAGIWDEGGWSRYEGRRQIALFGGMFNRKGIVVHISATGAASHPQSNHKYAATARIAAIDGQAFEDGQWVAMATCYDPEKGELSAYLNGKMTQASADFKEYISEEVFPHKKKQSFNPYSFNYPIYSPHAFVIKYNGYNFKDDGIGEHRISVDLDALTLIYEQEKRLPKEKSFRILFDVIRDDKSLLGDAMEIKGEHQLQTKIPLSVKIQNGDIIVTSLEQEQQGQWKQVGTVVKRTISEGAPFTFGRALGLGSDDLKGAKWGEMGKGADSMEYGSKIYIDGVAVFNRVLTEGELKNLSFGLGE
ncbi:MAG: glycoside hydrolase family 5 protein [Verrucomicrobiales bacterium]|nr:glycoside hydrolase family 5 protein [Verrucomicrobiales bacterium]